MPFIPEIDRAAIRFVYRLIDPDSAWQQARIANNQGLACIEGRQDVAEPTEAIGKKSLDNALILGVGQSHGYEVTALAEHRLIHFGRTLAYHDKAYTVLTAFLGDTLENIQGNIIG
ncbi:hypothetical protein D3C84_913360 [compost metagenome]